MSESALQADIMTALCLDSRVAWVMAVTTGQFKVKGGYITVGHYMMDDMKRKTGMTDLVGQLKDGRILCVEVKLPGETPKPEQEAFIEAVRASNGVSGYVTTIEETYSLLDASHRVQNG